MSVKIEIYVSIEGFSKQNTVVGMRSTCGGHSPRKGKASVELDGHIAVPVEIEALELDDESRGWCFHTHTLHGGHLCAAFLTQVRIVTVEKIAFGLIGK